METTKVILFSGPARSGKDTSANFLKDFLEQNGKTVLIYHFADTLKTLCECSYNWVRDDKGPIGRTILQNIGTEYRQRNPKCWINIVKEIILGCSEEYALIPDCRYRNEAFGILADFEGEVIKIERPNFDNGLTEEQKAHISENDMNGFCFSEIIINDGSLNDLKEKINKEFIREVT